MNPTRHRLAGVAAITAALDAGESIRLLLVAEKPADPSVTSLVERARSVGIEVRVSTERSLWRLSTTVPPAEVLALIGPDPGASLETVLGSDELVWQLAGLTYPGNTGFAIRTAEVSGAAGIVIDSDFDHVGRREAVRASMRADHFIPVFWRTALELIPMAQAAGREVFSIEDVGEAAPWEVDLTLPLVLVVGGERDGIPGAVLERCDASIRIPMRGFIPSYNVQAAMAMVAGERLRQEGATDGPARDR
jgi:23S rRNA (guanosine2251-2'-O)-methyltransferase